MEDEMWSLSAHARQRILEYGIDPRKVLQAATHWENQYGSGKGHPEHYRVRQYQDIAVVVDPETHVIITVLQRKREMWGRKAGQEEGQ